MAMMRLSPRLPMAGNLHQGAVGGACACAPAAPCGRCSLAARCATADTGLDLYDLKVPPLGHLLNPGGLLLQDVGLGYIGTDMVLDKFRGPMLLELATPVRALPSRSPTVAAWCPTSRPSRSWARSR